MSVLSYWTELMNTGDYESVKEELDALLRVVRAAAEVIEWEKRFSSSPDCIHLLIATLEALPEHLKEE